MRVLFAHENQLLREIIRNFLEKPGHDDAAFNRLYNVETTGSFSEALDKAIHDTFDAIIIGFDLPGMDCGAGLKRLRDACPDTGLGVVSGKQCSLDILARLIDCNASFIPESLSGAQFVLALDIVASGQAYLPVSAAQTTFRSHRQRCTGSANSKDLTPRETEVVSHLVQGLSNKEIARRLSIEEVTVRLHLRGVYRKLEARNRVQAVTIAVELGLMSEPRERHLHSVP